MPSKGWKNLSINYYISNTVKVKKESINLEESSSVVVLYLTISEDVLWSWPSWGSGLASSPGSSSSLTAVSPRSSGSTLSLAPSNLALSEEKRYTDFFREFLKFRFFFQQRRHRFTTTNPWEVSACEIREVLLAHRVCDLSFVPSVSTIHRILPYTGPEVVEQEQETYCKF